MQLGCPSLARHKGSSKGRAFPFISFKETSGNVRYSVYQMECIVFNPPPPLSRHHVMKMTDGRTPKSCFTARFSDLTRWNRWKSVSSKRKGFSLSLSLSGRFMHGQIAPLFSTNVALLKRSFCSFFRWNLILRLFFFFFQMLYGFRFLGWIMENNFFFFFLELSILRFWDWIKFIYFCGIYLETGL